MSVNLLMSSMLDDSEADKDVEKLSSTGAMGLTVYEDVCLEKGGKSRTSF